MDGCRDANLQALAVLDEPTRRRLYDYVIAQRAPVSRDEAASALALPRNTAAFHLDKLATEGLLTVVFERRSGRTGPGAGRPAKLYRRSDHEIEVSLPERQYDVAGHLLAAALEDADVSGESPRTALERRARRYGETIGRAGGDPLRLLEDHGFEPRSEGTSIGLANCPFHALAANHPELICHMTLSLVRGLLTDDSGYRAELDPQPGHCCVRLEPH